MKKTSFTLKSQTHANVGGSCCIPKWLTFCFALVLCFFANQGYTQTFGGMSDCAPASGNAINNNCPVAPAPVNAGPTCMVMVPNLQPAGGFAMADVTVGAGYAFISGSIQEPMPGSLVGPGTTDIYVGAIFNDIGGGTGLCAVACPAVQFTVNDVTPPVNNCMGAFIVNADDDCVIDLTDAFLRANAFNVDPSDNCTALADLVITTNVPSVGPMVCPGANPQNFPFIITVTDESGNSTPCAASINLLDNTDPAATFDPTFMGGAGFAFSVPQTVGCGGTIPDITGAVSGVDDNCSTPTVTQFPLAGTNAVGLVAPNPTTGCLEMTQDVTITVEDCFGNTTTQQYIVTYEDETPAEFIDPTLVCGLVMNDLDYIALGGLPLIADGDCMVTIPNLADEVGILGNVTDNCNPNPTVLQDPAPGLYSVFDICPPDNTIDVTFTPVDCDGNEGTPVTCDDLLSFTDNTPPEVVCPVDPITVVIPFDDATCEIGMAMVDLALLIAEGVTVTDNCDGDPQLVDVTPNMFTCSDMGKAGLTVSITAEDCFGNQNVPPTECDVEVVADVDHVADWSIGGGDFFVCPDEFPVDIVLGANTPGCGVWSGDVAVTGAAPGPYTLEAADFPDLDGDGNPDPGSYSITYTVGPLGCHIEQTHNIQVSPEFDADDAALVADFSICWEATETFDLEGLLAPGSVQGGLYTIALGGSATGTQTGNLFQYNGGDGTLTVTYTLEDCDGDIESDEVVITIDEKPDGHFTLAADMCQDEGVETPNITGVPAGATVAFVSSPVGFVTNATTGEFDPAAGPLAAEFVDVTVTMTVSNGVCADFTISQIVRVYESGDPAFTIPATICESAAPLDLLLDNPNNDGGANPLTADNVTWTGTSVGDLGATGTFDPSVGPGVYTICVTVGAPSCEEQLCQDIEVEPDYTADDVALIADFDLCADPDETLIDFSGLLDATAVPGGVFAVNVTGTIVGTANPNSYQYEEGCGTIEITYSFPDDCVPSEDVVTITIEQKPDVGGLNVSSPLCATDDPVIVDYSGTPEICGTAGVFSGPGITDVGTGDLADFDPAAAGEGQHDLFYDLTSPTGICNDVNLIIQVQVDASSPTDFTIPSEVCSGDVVDLALDSPDPSVLPTSPDGNTEIEWFGGDGVNAIVTDNGDGTGTFVGTVNGTYTICVRTGDPNCSQMECQQITVDIIAPVMDCDDLVRTRDNDAGECSFTMPGVGFDVTATDNCDPAPVLTHDYAPHVGTNANSLAGAEFPVGITQVIWTATDNAGNSSNCTIQIEIEDAEDATVQSCPTSFSQGTDDDICGAEITYVIPQFADNCDGADLEGVLVSGYAPGTDFPVGVTTVTWEYTDLADNATATCTFTVTVSDDDDPTAICSPAYAVSLDGDGEFDVLATDIDNASYDNCEIVSTLISRDGNPYAGSVTMTCADVTNSPITVTMQVTDAAGNTSTCTTDVTVNDDQVPDIECPGSITVVADPTTCAAVVTYPAPTVTDNCTFSVTQIDGTGLTSGSSFPVGTTVQTYQAEDIAGNIETCTFEVYVYDEVAPTIDCGPTVRTRSADAGVCSFTMPGTGFDAIGADNCPGVTITHNYPYAVDPNTLAGSTFQVGSTTVTWVATDASGNQSAICGIEIVVTDDEDPTIDCGTGGPANILMNPSFEANAGFDQYCADSWNCFGAAFVIDETISPAFPAAQDGTDYMKTFGGASGLIQEFPATAGEQYNGAAYFMNASFDPTGPGQFAVTKFEFVDAGNNIINFVESPMLFAGDLPTDTWVLSTVSAIAPANTVTVRFVVVSVSPGGGAVMMDAASLSVGTGGGMSGNISVSADDGECGAELNINNPDADDNCGIVSIINDYNSTQNPSDFYPVGITTVGFTATDASGNTAECTITVEVTDDEAPEFVNCPTTMVMVGNDVDECAGKLNWSIPVATDNCELASITQTAGPASGTSVPVGTAVDVTYTAVDIYGNSSECTFSVQVVDTQEPSFDADVVMPADITVECDAIPDNCVFHGSGTPCEPLDNDDVMDNCTAPGDLVLDFTEVSTQDPDPNVCGHYNYTLTRTWTVTDEAGNVLEHIQVITVEDTTAPVPTCQDASITLDKFGMASINPVDLIAGTTDNCAPFSALTVTASQTDFDCSDLGPNSVTITIADPCGNTAQCTITVTVSEGPAPCTPEAAVATSCLNNATTLENGQFEELITVTSLAMENWVVSGANGTFAANSPAPPAAPTPVPAGTALTMGTADGIDNDGDGQIDEADEMIYYTVLARFVEGVGYTANVTNGTTTIEVSNIAYYPTPDFTNVPDEICLGTAPFVPELTDLFAGSGAFNIVEILVNGVPVTEIDPAALGFGSHQVTVTVDAGDFTPSTYVDGVNVPGTAATNAESQLDPGCLQSVSTFFLVVETPTQVVCNDLVHVTLEQDCESTVTPDMVLEGTYACFDDYTVLITTPAGVPLNPADVVTGAHAGMELPYSLVHPISGNLCWGHILVEDKTNPEAICPPSVDILCTVDPDSIVEWLPFNHPCYPATDYFGNQVPVNGQLLYLGEPDAIDCSDWTWEYTDDYTSYDCSVNGALIAEIVRTFVITDEFGNQGTCTQVINKVRGEVDHINFPPDLTFACNDPILNSIAPNFAPAVLDDLFDNECGGNTQGWPEIWETDLTTVGTGVCGLGITYTDELVNICPNSYKVVRTWKVHDWCPAQGGAPTVTEYVQYIKVENVAPIVTVECDFYDSAGNCILNATEPGIGTHGDCYAIYVPFAQVDAVCDEIVEVTVETQAGFTTNGGYIPAPGLPIGGPYDIIYRAEDQCGNITEYTLTVVVEDKTAPIAVCDEITDVNLTSNGEAVVFAETFDDGSYDNCALQDLEVRRMTDNCGVPGNTSWGPSVTFCCEDVTQNPIMVVFRAVDYNGNYNECMVEVNVQDKIAPIAVSCPANQRITCDWYADNLETQLANAADDEEQCDILDTYFGVAEFFDNCEPIIVCNVNVNLDQCLEGTISRNYTVSDPSGNQITNQCNQTIFVDHVSDWVVEFPADITVECGTTTPEFGEPEIFFETCELVAVSYEDEVFNVVPDACYKILRTWTVINWCVVGDEIDEEFEEDPENQLGLPFPACDLDGDGDCDNRTFRDSWANGTYPGAADATTTLGPDTDFDSDPWDGYITYQQTIKVNDTVDPVFTNGCEIDDVCIEDNTCVAAVNFPTPDIDECSENVTFSVSSDLGSGFGPFFNVAPGTYEVTYTAMDNCNNQTTCETTVTVNDCKKPTPYCKNGIIVELMQTCMVEVWASDLDAGSFDNCPGDVLLSFSSDVDDIGITFTNDDLGQQPVELWVTDAAGNQDFCETFVVVQNNMHPCDDPLNTSAVSGLINTEEDEAVADVDVQLSGSNQMSVMSDINGMFNFSVENGGDYTVTPVKDDEPLNGVTTFDLVLITQHILGTTPLSSPYKMIAADANNSQSITTFDVLTLRKLILFIDLEFQNNTSWRFVDKDYDFPEPTNPWAEIFPEVVSFNNISADELSTDFVAVKVGDVNGSASLVAGATEDRNANGTLVFNVDDVKLTEGQSYQVDFTAEDFAVMGYQFTLNFDQKVLDFVDVIDAVAGAENFGLSLLEEGAITASWNKDNVKLADGEVVFSLVFDAKASANLSDVLSVNSRYTQSEAYQQNGDLLDVELRFNGQSVAGFDLYQNTPNPFSSTTIIGFNLPEASAATLTITDVSGKVVKTIEGDYAKGYNEISLERRDLPAVGILYYQLDSNNDSATRMMLLVD